MKETKQEEYNIEREMLLSKRKSLRRINILLTVSIILAVVVLGWKVISKLIN